MQIISKLTNKLFKLVILYKIIKYRIEIAIVKIRKSMEYNHGHTTSVGYLIIELY